MNWFANLRERLTGAKAHDPERRRLPRYRMQFDVTVAVDGRSHRARSADLSQTGIAVYLAADIEIGKQVMLTYQLGDGSDPKTVRAVVRNHSEGRYGLEFC